MYLADPQALDRAASWFRPHLVVCNDIVPDVGEEVSVPSWVVVRYHDHLSVSVFLDDQDPYLVQDMTTEALFGVIDEARRLVVGGSSS